MPEKCMRTLALRDVSEGTMSGLFREFLELVAYKWSLEKVGTWLEDIFYVYREYWYVCVCVYLYIL